MLSSAYYGHQAFGTLAKANNHPPWIDNLFHKKLPGMSRNWTHEIYDHGDENNPNLTVL